MPTMTVGRLHKMLGEQIAKGHARKPVCVAKESFYHPLEADGCSILDATTAALLPIVQTDDDGGTAFNKDGSERYRTCLVIGGGYQGNGGGPSK